MTSTPRAEVRAGTALSADPGPLRPRWEHWLARTWPFAVFAVLIAVLLGPSLAGKRVALGHDLLLAELPWRAAYEDSPAPVNLELRDTLDVYFPVQHELISRLRSGQDASWLEDVSLGMPGVQFVGWGALSPFNLPALVLPFDLAWSWAMALRLFTAMAGAYALTRSLGSGRSGAAIAGIAFGLSGYMIGWLGWPQTHVGAFIPWVWWAARLAARPSPRAWAVPGLAAATAGLWLGGFPAVAVYGLLGAGVVAAHAAWQGRTDGGARATGAGLLRAGAGIALGTGLAAFTLLPSLLFLGELDLSTRVAQWRTRIPATALPTFLVPGLYGDLVHHRWWHGGSRVEQVGYAGVVTLALGGVGWLLRPRKAGLGLFTALAAGFTALAYGMPPLRHIVRVTPLLSSNSPARALALAGLAVAVVGGLGADSVVRWAAGRAKTTRAMLLAGALALAALLAAAAAWNPARWLHRFAIQRVGDGGAPDVLRVAASESAKAAALIAAAGVIIGVALILRRRASHTAAARLAGIGLAAVVSVDLLASAAGLNPQVPRTPLFPDAPGLMELAEASAEHRVAGTDSTLMANTHLEYDFRDVRAHTFVTARQRALVSRFGGVFLSQTRWDLTVAESSGWDPWISALGVSAILTPPDVSAVLGSAIVQRERRAIIGPLIDDAVVYMTAIALEDGHLTGVLLRFGTFHGAADQGDIAVEVMNESGERASAVVPVADLTDNAWRMFELPALEVARGDRVRLEIRGTATDPARAAALWGAEPTAGDAAGDPALGLVLAHDGLPREDLDGVTLFRNPNALPLMYAVARGVAVDPGEAPAAVEGAGASGLADVVFVEPSAAGALPALPTGDGDAVVTEWERGGARRWAMVESENGALLVVLDQLFPGWSATVNGEPALLLRANELFMAVPVPPGRHEVELTYRSPGGRAGVAVSIASLLALGSWTAIAAWSRPRRRPWIAGSREAAR